MFQLRGGRSKLKQAPPVNLSEEIRGAKKQGAAIFKSPS
jgi:hypothetical protein